MNRYLSVVTNPPNRDASHAMLLATVSPDQDLHTTQIDSRVAATTPTRPEAGERALAAAFLKAGEQLQIRSTTMVSPIASAVGHFRRS